MGQRNIYIANTSRVVDFGGTRVAIRKGRTTAETGAPILEAFPGMFDPVEAQHKAAADGGGVEQATAAPGERRDAPPDVAKKATGTKKSAAKKATASKGRNDDGADGDDDTDDSDDD